MSSTLFKDVSADDLQKLPPRHLRTLRLLVSGLFYRALKGTYDFKLPCSLSVRKVLFADPPQIKYPDILPTVLKTLDDLGVPFEGDHELGIPLLEHAVACLT